MKSEQGRSLIEMLGILAIGAVMTAAAYTTYNTLRTNQIRNLAVSELEQIARNTKILLETRGDYTGVSVEYLIKAGAITNDAAPLGDEKWSVTAESDGAMFAINLSNISNGDCVYFSTKKLDWAEKISINKLENGGAERCISGNANMVSFIVK